jgi:PAS domain S-box-containing protein
MNSEYASIQIFHPERGSGGELRLLASRGFNPHAATFWEWVRADGQSTCGVALRTGQRVVAADISQCDFMAGTEDLQVYLQTGIRAVQTTPLVSRSGRLLGMISTHWREPHDPSEGELRLLDLLARQAADFIERAESEAALRQSEERFRIMSDNITQLAWTCDRLGEVTWYNQRWLDYTGLTFEEMKGWGWEKVQHPDHVDRVVASVKHSRDTGEIWEDTFPLRGKDGNYRWFLSRAVPIRDAAGDVVRWFGTNTDVTELRDAEAHQQLLINELNHRVKNTLAMVQAIAAQTFRGAGTVPELQEAFEARLIALANAHSILTQGNWESADIGDVVAQSIEPYAGSDRLQMQGPSIRLSPRLALAIAMGIHELATNAVKYGALSNGTGRVAITWSIDGARPGTLNLQWVESGGPHVNKPTQKGFGSRLIERNLAHDLDGEARIDYRPEGVICTITSPLEIGRMERSD